MALEARVQRALEEPLAKDAVRTRLQGGQQLSYLEGWSVIDQANKVFGHDGWSYQVRGMQVVADYERGGKNGTNRVMIVQATVRVTALGCTREDVGIGVCDASAQNPAAGIEKSFKEAVTDALERCLRTYGYRFGLALYDKEREHVGGTAESLRLHAALDDAADDELVEWWREHAEAIKALDEGEREEIKAAFVERRHAVPHPALARLEGELASVETPDALRACWADNASAIQAASEGNGLLARARDLLCDFARTRGWARTKAEVDALLGKGAPAGQTPAPRESPDVPAPVVVSAPVAARVVDVVQRRAPEAPAPADPVGAFCSEVERLAARDDAVALWIKHRDAIKLLSPTSQDACRATLVRRVMVLANTPSL